MFGDPYYNLVTGAGVFLVDGLAERTPNRPAGRGSQPEAFGPARETLALFGGLKSGSVAPKLYAADEFLSLVLRISGGHMNRRDFLKAGAILGAGAAAAAAAYVTLAPTPSKGGNLASTRIVEFEPQFRARKPAERPLRPQRVQGVPDLAAVGLRTLQGDEGRGESPGRA